MFSILDALNVSVERIFFFLRGVVPVAYGGSQDMGLIGAIAAGLHHSHSNSGSNLSL